MGGWGHLASLPLTPHTVRASMYGILTLAPNLIPSFFSLFVMHVEKSTRMKMG